ncbi:NADH-quinone oxidoreductase subunit NuoE family protein [Thermopirellula anaerolimosa]
MEEHNPEQPITPDMEEAVRRLFPRYPTRRAVVLPALHIIQERLGCVPRAAIRQLSGILEVPAPEIQDTLSFYGFFKQDGRLGRYRVWVCRSLSCALCGGEDLLGYLEEKLGVRPGETTPDGLFTLEHAECLGACDFAPAVLINEELHPNMNREKLDRLLAELAGRAGTAADVPGRA